MLHEWQIKFKKMTHTGQTMVYKCAKPQKSKSNDRNTEGGKKYA